VLKPYVFYIFNGDALGNEIPTNIVKMSSQNVHLMVLKSASMTSLSMTSAVGSSLAMFSEPDLLTGSRLLIVRIYNNLKVGEKK
jgi:hypothetical protein